MAAATTLSIVSHTTTPDLPATMRAFVLDAYGTPDTLAMRDTARPEPAPDEVLVEVVAAGLCGDDWHIMQGLPYAARLATGLLRPKSRVMGLDLAGRVVAVGAEVTRFQLGDAVFGWADDGAYGEYAAVPEGNLTHKPDCLTFEQAAGLPISGFTALQAVRDAGGVQPGQRVLVNGASGGVGIFAVQIARALGAEVTGVCSTRHLELVRRMGATHVIDYTTTDFTALGEQYDVIVDLAHSQSLKALRGALTPTGTLVMAGSSAITQREMRGRHRWFKGTDRWLKALFLGPFTRQKLRPLVHADRHEDLVYLRNLADQNQLTVTGQTWPLDQLPQAILAGNTGGKATLRVQ